MKNKEKSVIITHGDCDGICAGAIALSHFPESYVFFTRPASFLDDLKGIDAERIVVTDIALTKRDAPEIVRELRKKNCEILYFDHHEIPRNVGKKRVEESASLYVNKKNQSSSEIIYNTYKNEIPKERVWIAIYGAIGDYLDDTPFVRKRILNWDKRALYFEVSSITLGIKNEEFSDYDAKRRLVSTLASGRNPSNIPGLVQSARKAVNREFKLYKLIKRKAMVSGHVAYTLDVPTFGFRGPSALFSATVKNAPVGISVHTREKYIDITIRTRDYSLKLNRLAERAADFVNGSGGGHETAAGAKIPLGSFDVFLKKLNKEIEKMKNSL